MSGESIFRTTGNPSSRAALFAESMSCAMRVSTTGIPYARRIAFASGSLSSDLFSRSALVHDRPGGGRFRGIGVQYRRGRFEQHLLVAPILHPLQEGRRGLLRRFIGGYARIDEYLPRPHDRVSAKPARKHRRSPIAQQRCASERDRRAVHDGSGRMDEQQRIDLRIRSEDLEGFDVARRGCVADDVDRIAMRPGRRQHAIERGNRRIGQCGQLGAAEADRVGREHARAAAVGEDRDALAGQRAWRTPASRPRQTDRSWWRPAMRRRAGTRRRKHRPIPRGRPYAKRRPWRLPERGPP